jgi:hypothetical protein
VFLREGIHSGLGRRAKEREWIRWAVPCHALKLYALFTSKNGVKWRSGSASSTKKRYTKKLNFYVFTFFLGKFPKFFKNLSLGTNKPQPGIFPMYFTKSWAVRDIPRATPGGFSLLRPG